jgi:hypothetical protein
MRTHIWIGLILILGWSSVAFAQEDSDLAAAIEQRIVTDDDFARDDLYSWTTADNVFALRRDREILVATASSGDGPTPFNRALKTVAKRKDQHGAIAKLLLGHETLQRRRYAWTSPFGTAKPRGKRSYGHHLIRIRLRKEGWTGHFEPGKRKPFHFVNADGDAVALAEVIGNPERIAAIFHTRRPPAIPEGFREYVLCNQGMILGWSIGTEEILERVHQESVLLRRLASEAPKARKDAYRQWSKRDRLVHTNLARRYQATLAFDIRHYRVRAKKLLRVAEALEAYTAIGPALEVQQ